MTTVQQKETGFTIQGRVETNVYDVESLRDKHPTWHDFTRKRRLSLLSYHDPDEYNVTTNVTTDRFHEYFVDNLDSTQTSAEDNIDITWMAIGDDGGSGVASSDTDLNNRLYSETIDSTADDTKDIVFDTLLSSSEGNGNTYDEIGVYTGDPSNLGNSDVFLCNHATISSTTKDATKAVTFQVTISFSDV